MRKRDYETIQRLLCERCSLAIQGFASGEENLKVYVFSIYCAAEHGWYVPALNTQAGFKRVVQKSSARKQGQDLTGFFGVKFNPPDFAFFDLGPRSNELEALGYQYSTYLKTCGVRRTVEKHKQMFVDQAILAIENLGQSFELLNRTEDFVAYVSPYDADKATSLSLFRRTVPSDQFQRLFPETIAFEETKERIAGRPVEEQIQFWLEMCVKLSLKQTSGLETLDVTQHDALDNLKELGKVAVSPILSVIEQYAGCKELNTRGTQAFAEMGAFTCEADLTHLLLLGIIDIGYGDVVIRDRLGCLLRQVYNENRDKDLSGLNPSLVARALHSLFPRRYPKPRISGSTNHLLNPASFGLGKESGT
jgi:hypothetical protein